MLSQQTGNCLELKSNVTTCQKIRGDENISNRDDRNKKA